MSHRENKLHKLATQLNWRLTLRLADLHFYLLCGITLFSTPLFSIDVDTASEQFARNLELEIQTKLNHLNDEEAAFLVTIYLKPIPSTKKEIATAPTTGTEVGYVPIPLGDRSDVQVNEERKTVISFQAVQVVLNVLGEAQPDVVESAKEIIRNSTRGLNATLEVKSMKGKPPAKEKPPAPLPPSPPEKLDLKTLLPLFPVPLASLFLFFGLLIIGLALRSIAGGVLATINLRNNSLSQPPEIAKTAQPPSSAIVIPGGESKKGGARFNNKADYHRFITQIGFIKQTLQEAPKFVGRCIRNQRVDAIGIRRILPHLDDSEKEALKNALTPGLVAALSRPNAGGDEDFNQIMWIEDFVERLALEVFRGRSAIETAVGEEKNEYLHQVPEKDLLAVVKSLDLGTDRATWRLLAEYLPPEKLSNLLEQGSLEHWRAFTESSRVSNQEVAIAADRLITHLQKKVQSTTALNNEEEYYLSTIVLNSVVTAIKNKLPSESDALLVKIFEAVPELQAKILERIWTPSCLRTVPKTQIAAVFRGLSTEDKALLLWILPPEHSEAFDDLLPEGNVRVIISDKIQKLKVKHTPKELKKAADLCQAFLEKLRIQEQKGEFTVLAHEEKTSENSVTTNNKAA